jgi:alkanesulfonate monooxygenase SsuD/methylene tetrahydromethanopterin reductase-like flavin-dependent oxidoreductase (luciferase family)
MRIWVEIDRDGFIETRSVSGTEEEVEEHLAHWIRQYGQENVKVVLKDG